MSTALQRGAGIRLTFVNGIFSSVIKPGRKTAEMMVRAVSCENFLVTRLTLAFPILVIFSGHSIINFFTGLLNSCGSIPSFIAARIPPTSQ